MSIQENDPLEQQLENQKQNVKKEFKGLFSTIKSFLTDLLNIREDTDKEHTITKIKAGIPVKSHTAWVLIFSIFIASIGLNVSSTAVVIGAMLVSPLMGPILGLGLSIGINDIDTLKRSLVNLGVMVGLSIATSFIFFSFPIFQDATPELLARTAPDVRDVLIALAGGLSLIIALSRKSEMTNTIAGIAIATALMPPLCTAGFGLATWNLDYFFGALFLFIINAIFIALATFLIVKFLGFPVVKYLNQAKRKRIAQIATFVATLIIGFSIYQFYLLFQENKYQSNAEHFISQLQEKTGAGIIDTDINYHKKIIKIVVLGQNVNQKQEQEWNQKLADFNLENSVLQIQQDNKATSLQNEIETIKKSYLKTQNIMATKDEIIHQKESLILEQKEEITQLKKQEIPFVQLSKEAHIIFKGLQKLSYAKKYETNFEKLDTLFIFEANWIDSLTTDVQKKSLQDWLKTRIKNNKIKLESSTL